MTDDQTYDAIHQYLGWIRDSLQVLRQKASLNGKVATERNLLWALNGIALIQGDIRAAQAAAQTYKPGG